MESGRKKTTILILGVAGGLLLAGLIAFIFKLLLVFGIISVVKKDMNEFTEEAKAKQRRLEISAQNFQKTKAKNAMIQRMENSDECRFWRQQLEINKRAVSKINEYCYYGPEHEAKPHAHSDKIWKSNN